MSTDQAFHFAVTAAIVFISSVGLTALACL
jgi:hypothetical protein